MKNVGKNKSVEFIFLFCGITIYEWICRPIFIRCHVMCM